MLMLTSALVAVHHSVHHLVALGPPVGTPSLPAGLGQKFSTILGWLSYTVDGLAIVGIFAVAGKMMVAHRRGDPGEHFAGLAIVLAGIILVGAASGIVSAIG